MNAAKVLVFGSKIMPRLWLVPNPAKIEAPRIACDDRGAGEAGNFMAKRTENQAKSKTEKIHPLVPVRDLLLPIVINHGDAESKMALELGMELLWMAFWGPSVEHKQPELIRKLWKVRRGLAGQSKRDRDAGIKKRIVIAAKHYHKFPTKPAEMIIADLCEWFKHDPELVALLRAPESTKEATRVVRAMRSGDDRELGQAGAQWFASLDLKGKWSDAKRTEAKRNSRASK